MLGPKPVHSLSLAPSHPSTQAHLDYGWIACGLGAARNAGTCVAQISEAVMGAMETTLFLVSLGSSSGGTTAAKVSDGLADGGKATDDALDAATTFDKIKDFGIKAITTLMDPQEAGKLCGQRMKKILGWVDDVGDVVDAVADTKKLATQVSTMAAIASTAKDFVQGFKDTMDVVALGKRVLKAGATYQDMVDSLAQLYKMLGYVQTGVGILMDDPGTDFESFAATAQLTGGPDETTEMALLQLAGEGAMDYYTAQAEALCLLTTDADEADHMIEIMDVAKLTTAWGIYRLDCTGADEAVVSDMKEAATKERKALKKIKKKEAKKQKREGSGKRKRKRMKKVVFLETLATMKKKKDHCAELEAMGELEEDGSGEVDEELEEELGEFKATAQGMAQIAKVNAEWNKVRE